MKPDSSNLLMMDVRLPITLTPKIPVPNITSETVAPTPQRKPINEQCHLYIPLPLLLFQWLSPVS